MSEFRSVLILIALLLAAGCTRQPSPPNHGSDLGAVRTAAVRSLFDSMRNGAYTTPVFPELTWDHIPALLALADSRQTLISFPHNPLSSQSQSTCSEGMVALWLVEGIRKGGQFASLNPLCFGNAAKEEPWTTASERNHDPVLTAYRTWWTKVSGLTKDRGAAMNPLEGTGLHWH
ncbi:MAG: DUF4943 family protein [Planctomycetota bacterium]